MRLNNVCGAWTLNMGRGSGCVIAKGSSVEEPRPVVTGHVYLWHGKHHSVLTWVFFRMITLLYSKVCTHWRSISPLCEVQDSKQLWGTVGRGVGGADGQSCDPCAHEPVAEPPVLALSGSCCRNLAPCLSLLCSLLDTLTWHLKTTRASTWSSQRQH